MMRDYSDNDPKGWCGDPKRGAALGRVSEHDPRETFSHKLRLVRVRLDSGGYDQNGTYFGTGLPLYWYANESGTIDAVLRAPTRVAAKAYIRIQYPNARFYR